MTTENKKPNKWEGLVALILFVIFIPLAWGIWPKHGDKDEKPDVAAYVSVVAKVISHVADGILTNNSPEVIITMHGTPPVTETIYNPVPVTNVIAIVPIDTKHKNYLEIGTNYATKR